MTTRYLEDPIPPREARIIKVLRVFILLAVWTLVAMAAFACWLATAG